MSKIKSLILGSAAGFAAIAGAQAADLPVKAKAVQYVKVCSLYGAGFYYIPGTDTCIRIGGHIRLDLGFNSQNTYDTPAWQGGGTGLQSRARDFYQTRMRISLQNDTRTATEYGVVRTFSDVKFEWANTRDNMAGGFIEVDYGFIQFAGFTFGKAVSNFDAPWILSMPTINSFVIGGSDNKTGITQIAYTAQLGNGVSGSIAMEDSRAYRRAGIADATGAPIALATPVPTNYGTSQNNFLGNVEAGTRMPDIVGNLRLDQAWGSFHVAAAVHEVTATYYSNGLSAATSAASAAFGNPESKFGYAVSGAIELKNLPTGVGDSLKVDATYAKGAPKYVFGGTFDTIGSGRLGSVDAGNRNTFATGLVLDGLFASAGGLGGGTNIELSTSYGVRAFFEHYWTPQWRTSVWGGIAWQEYNGAAAPLAMAALRRASYAGAGAATLGGNPNFSLTQIGTTTSWTPVKDLTLSAEFTYGRLDTNLVGVTTVATSPGKVYSYGDANFYNGAFRILRSF